MSLISRFMNAQMRDDTVHESWATLGDTGEEGMFMAVGPQQNRSDDNENSSELSEDILAELSIEDAASGDDDDDDGGDDDDDLLSLDSSDSDEAPAEEAKPAAGGGEGSSDGDGGGDGEGGEGGGGGKDVVQTVSGGAFGDDLMSAFRSATTDSESNKLTRNLENISMNDLLTDMKEIHQMFGDRIVPEEEPEEEAEESA